MTVVDHLARNIIHNNDHLQLCAESLVNESTIGDMAFNLADKADERAVQYWNLLLILLYAFVFLVGMFGNSLVIYVVLRYSKMQTVTNMYIFNLAIADEMFLIGLLFLIITVINKQWLFGRVWCKVYLSITSINQVTSSFLLMVMSFDRYLAVCHPIIAPKYRTPFLAKFICLTVWAVAAILMVPIFMYGDVLEIKKEPPMFSCNIFWPTNEIMAGDRAFTLYSVAFGFVLPVTMILIFYLLIILRLKRLRKRVGRRVGKRTTVLVSTIVFVFIFSWIFYWIGQLYITFIITPQPPQPRSEILRISLLLASCLTYANSAVNPILYAFLSENFKKSFAKAFTCAAKKDVNAQLNAENSAFPRLTKGSQSKGGKAKKNGNNNNNVAITNNKSSQGRADSIRNELSDNNPSSTYIAPSPHSVGA